MATHLFLVENEWSSYKKSLRETFKTCLLSHSRCVTDGFEVITIVGRSVPDSNAGKEYEERISGAARQSDKHFDQPDSTTTGFTDYYTEPERKN